VFTLAILYCHFGLQTSIPIGKYFTGGVRIVNVGDNNTGKTIGFTGTITTKKLAWSNNYYAGPENPNTNKGWRHLYDTTLPLTPSAKLNVYINFDYGGTPESKKEPGHGYVGTARVLRAQAVTHPAR